MIWQICWKYSQQDERIHEIDIKNSDSIFTPTEDAMPDCRQEFLIKDSMWPLKITLIQMKGKRDFILEVARKLHKRLNIDGDIILQ